MGRGGWVQALFPTVSVLPGLSRWSADRRSLPGVAHQNGARSSVLQRGGGITTSTAALKGHPLLVFKGKKHPGGSTLQKPCITQAQPRPEKGLVGGCVSCDGAAVLRKLDQAFRNCWKRKGHARAPRLKKRSNRQSIPLGGKEFRTTDRSVRFPKVGELRLLWSRPRRPLPDPALCSRSLSRKAQDTNNRAKARGSNGWSISTSSALDSFARTKRNASSI